MHRCGETAAHTTFSPNSGWTLGFSWGMPPNTVCAGVGKWLHTLHSHPTLGEPRGLAEECWQTINNSPDCKISPPHKLGHEKKKKMKKRLMTYLSRMHETRRFSTSCGSMFSSWNKPFWRWKNSNLIICMAKKKEEKRKERKYNSLVRIIYMEKSKTHKNT